MRHASIITFVLGYSQLAQAANISLRSAIDAVLQPIPELSLNDSSATYNATATNDTTISSLPVSALSNSTLDDSVQSNYTQTDSTSLTNSTVLDPTQANYTSSDPYLTNSTATDQSLTNSTLSNTDLSNATSADGSPANSTMQNSSAINTDARLNVRAPTNKNGPYSYLKAMAKFKSKFTLEEAQTIDLDVSIKALSLPNTQSLAAQQASTAFGYAASTGSSDDSQWLTEAQIGTPPQTLLLNFDTGSSDLWVFSTDLPIAARQKQVLYSPASSRSSLSAPTSTWNITYADASGASGFVGVDTLTLGGMAIKNQAIERATYVSKDFFSSTMASGLLGLAFSSINTVKPNPVITPVENMIRQNLIPSPIFTVTLRDADSNATGQGGHYTFGYLDQNSYKGQITYAPVNTSQGFWQVNSPYFKIGRNGNPIPRNPQTATTGTKARRASFDEGDSVMDDLLTSMSQSLSVVNASSVASQLFGLGDTISRLASQAGGLSQLAAPDHPVIIDTGTTLMLIDDATLLTIYNQIPGAAFNRTVGGYTLPCSTTSPDTFYMIGDQFFGIPGRSLPFAPLDNGICFGGIQSRGSFPMDIYGDTFIKNNYVVFDQGTPPRVGVAYRPDIAFATK